jgi:folate-binding Fe-S cluster repair protein YgfZ
MARLNSRGRTRRKLCRVKGDGVPPSLPCAVFDLDAKVGELKSVVAYASGYLGLALLSVAALEKASEFSLEAHTTPKVKID